MQKDIKLNLQEVLVHLTCSLCSQYLNWGGVLVSSGTTSVCIPDPEHLVYMFSMSGVAHQRLSQVSKISLRLSRPVLHLPTASTSAAVGVLDAHAGTEAVAERPPLRLCG